MLHKLGVLSPFQLAVGHGIEIDLLNSHNEITHRTLLQNADEILTRVSFGKQASTDTCAEFEFGLTNNDVSDHNRVGTVRRIVVGNGIGPEKGIELNYNQGVFNVEMPENMSDQDTEALQLFILKITYTASHFEIPWDYLVTGSGYDTPDLSDKGHIYINKIVSAHYCPGKFVG